MHVAELESIGLAGIVAYLRSTGWRESGTYVRTVVWTRDVDGAEAEVLVPDSQELRGYASRVAELVNTVASVEGRTAADVLVDLHSPTVDVQYIRTMPDGPSGTTPLHEGYLAVKGVRDLFLVAATSATSEERPTVLPGRKPAAAQGFLDQVRLGIPSKGSYVLRIETPLPPPGVVPPVSSRDVLLHLYQATSAAHAAALESRDGNFTPFGDRVGDGVSANLCQALADIGGVRQSPFELRFAWAPAEPQELATPPVEFAKPTIAVLKGGAKYLRELPVTETVSVAGRVVDLHRSPMDRLGRVQIEGTILSGALQSAEKVTVTMRLTAEQYGLAVRAHGSQQRLLVVGQLRYTGRQFEMSQVADIELA